ncbi:MAG TPA: MoaD/ThiS family protein [Desulfobacterales bacterium]|nr:MoaD/ThiS family protein [Desulfobacterales bacterium]
MKIEVKLYGSLKKYAPEDKTNFSLTLTPGTTVEVAITELGIPPDAHVSLINGRHATKETPLKNDVTLVLYPPVAGG